LHSLNRQNKIENGKKINIIAPEILVRSHMGILKQTQSRMETAVAKLYLSQHFSFALQSLSKNLG